jgi:hypothetical protein
MRVVVKEPIQSLNAFGRHINGGRNAALPLFNLNHHFMTISVILGLSAFMANAQQKEDTNRSTTNEQRIDLLFDQIMKTLPDGERMKVDSAASMEISRREPARVQTPVLQERDRTARAKRVDELSPELKAQVERTINSMELRKEERKAHFRESARERR